MNTKKKKTLSTKPQPRRLNDCLTVAYRHKAGRMLFDECWGEGELVMFIGESGVGKTIFSLQLGDAIARGRPIEGFRMTALRQKTLYVDLKHSDMQIRARYASARGRKFSENLYCESPPVPADLVTWLHATIKAHGYRVVIVDDIFALSRTYTGTRETLTAMRELRRLTRELSISMLVLAGSRKPPKQIVSEADLMSNRILCDAADSIFALGHHPHKPGHRYLIQTRSAMRPVYWTEHNAPVCSLAHRADGMLAFCFDKRFEAKIDPELRDLICNIKSQHDHGATYREIAECLGISYVRAWRLKKLWVPSMEEEYVLDQSYDDDLDEPEKAAAGSDGTVHEIYSAAQRIEHADGGEPEFIETEMTEFNAAALNARLEVAESIQLANMEENKVTHADEAETSVFDPLAHLKRTWDKNDREIFVETEDECGRPTVWYLPNSNGKFTRFKRSGYGSIGQIVEGPMTPLNAS